MAPTFKHAALTLALSVSALVGACGPATPPPADPGAQGTMPAPEPVPTLPTHDGTAPSEAPSAAPTSPITPPRPGEPAHSRPLSPTQMEEGLKKIGLDPMKLPLLEKMPLAQKKKVMPLLQKSLGMESCLGCHKEGDFQTETRNMKVAREMWRHFVAPLRTEAGGAVFCDSCHGGDEHVLARADRKALEAFMDAEYVQKLSRADKSDMECGTCHGDTMELQIIEKLWKIPEG
ncbi:hypothetical protein [Chondromyces apiculatus]|uniref:Uncharacterized protein n=1 Tax=Chondromyces apiculatus DSM 436 TaxID=1192034 RepID=A0A017TGA0_9BACT|nr:hypothetical protein [Chondromyces apiculatus]EYF07942.1 Hypothetical protein CAP_6964 [Chondromyces apiculatus DSM 436]